MRYLLQNTVFALLVLVMTVFVQLIFYGVYLGSFQINQVIMFFVCMVVIGLLTTLLARPISRVIFFAASGLPQWVNSVLDKQSGLLLISRPEILVSRTVGINAFAISDLLHNGVVIVQQDIFKQLTQDEIEAVLAHELSHVALRHTLVLTILQGICLAPILPFVLVASGFVALIYDLRKFRTIFLILQNFFILIIYPLPSILIAVVTRFWEYDADNSAANIVGREQYIAALRCLHGSFFQHPNLLSTSTIMRSQVNREGWALSHPGLIQRINALRDNG